MANVELRAKRHKQTFENIFKRLSEAPQVAPRGQLVKEVENFSYTLPPYVRFPAFKSRNYKIDYVRKEFLWYLRANRFDRTICNHAKMWNELVNDDGSINSNYGQYIFGQYVVNGIKYTQFDRVVQMLKDDKDSRRASIVILNDSHLFSDTKDLPCTYSVGFRIRFDRLNMSVHMRSQDAIFGMGNDAPAFSFVHEMVLESLKETYPTLIMGDYHHIADSFHVYERHFEMLKKIVDGDEFELVDCPRINGIDEVQYLRHLHEAVDAFGTYPNVPETFKFTRWLIS